ncbi:MAG: DNA methyltransferase [Chloroflexi bacterium]|nr:DNA methyltransferase [Chloroflexota bacterium]
MAAAPLNSPTSVIYTLDNLKVLRGLNSQCIDLIYLDPPFNTGKQWYNPIGEGGSDVGFNDIWGWDRITGETLEQTIARQWEEERDYAGTAVREVVEAAVSAHDPTMGSYCAWMAPRLIEMQRVLKDTGSIYLHCDPFASHYLKLLMDAIFGQEHFRNEIVWKRRTGSLTTTGRPLRFGAITDSILFYARSNSAPFARQYSLNDPQYQQYIEKHFRHRDDNGRRYRIDNLASPSPRPNLVYAYKGYEPPANGWAISREKMEQWDREGRLHFPNKPSGRIQRRRYKDELRGKLVQSLWADIPAINFHAKERLGYPTQKPLALLDRIIAASSNDGDIVLDPFAGCATACIAAQKLGRRWIGIDVEPQAVKLCRMRLINELGFEGITEELTVPPERNDVRQLELIPRNRALRLELWQRMQKAQGTDNPPCRGCGRAPGVDYMEVDHIIPRSRGGEHTWGNVQLLCGPCNRSKGNRPWATWRRQSPQTLAPR